MSKLDDLLERNGAVCPFCGALLKLEGKEVTVGIVEAVFKCEQCVVSWVLEEAFYDDLIDRLERLVVVRRRKFFAEVFEEIDGIYMKTEEAVEGIRKYIEEVEKSLEDRINKG